MGRSRGSGRAPVRPTAAPSRPKVAPQQTRPASTAANPTAMQQRPGQQVQQAGKPASQGPGLFGQMASTAAGVAVGSTIGHALGGFFGGGSSAPAEQQSNAVADQSYGSNGAYQQQQQAPVCQQDVLKFRQCMDQNQGDLMTCGWYLDQLKACQQAASQY